MSDLISRQDAIALLNAEKVNAAETEDATDEAYNMAIVHCIEALTNMPSAGVHIELKAAQGSGVYGYSIYEDKP